MVHLPSRFERSDSSCRVRDRQDGWTSGGTESATSPTSCGLERAGSGASSGTLSLRSTTTRDRTNVRQVASRPDRVGAPTAHPRRTVGPVVIGPAAVVDPAADVPSDAPGWLQSRCLAAIEWYQRSFAGRPSPCRFYPTCSVYAHESFAVHGTRRGTWLTIRRLLRCRPFGPSGFDPVPESDDSQGDR